MSKRKRRSRWFLRTLMLFIIVVLAIILFDLCNPKPPPTPTPTLKPTITATLKPTDVVPTLIPTKTLKPTRTPYPTFQPKTPTPAPPVVVVHTGYEEGWLHFREGPSLKYRPLWREGLGAVQENTILELLGCPDVQYPWVWVRYVGLDGYVYGEFVDPNICSR